MKRLLIAACLSLLAVPAMAQTTELQVLSPGVVYNAGLLDLAASVRSTQADQARAVIAYLMQPEHRALWASKGLERIR